MRSTPTRPKDLRTIRSAGTFSGKDRACRYRVRECGPGNECEYEFESEEETDYHTSLRVVGQCRDVRPARLLVKKAFVFKQFYSTAMYSLCVLCPMWFTRTSVLLFMISSIAYAQDYTLEFGTEIPLGSALSIEEGASAPIRWVNVNTADDTWQVDGDELLSTGLPIGVMRSEKQYENFILHVEWMHLEPGGNSGVFVWSKAIPDEKSRLPDGVEVQMLELDWVNLNKRDGTTPPIAYVHGELFGVGGVETVPDNPRGTRSKSVENRCKGRGEWNTYDAVCVDGVIKLSVNGKFVNGISQATQRKGYLCLEAEGAPIRFRNLTIIELPP